MKKSSIILLISITLLTLIIIFVLNYTGKSSKIDNIDTEEEKDIEIGTYRYGGDIENGSLRLHNNVWGLTKEEKETQIVKSYIYYKFNGNFGWEWDRPDPGPNSDIYIPPIYPEVTIGTIPYVTSPYPTTSYLPVKLTNINSMTAEVEYKYIKYPTGSYNLAYDIWFIDNNGTKKAEVMIWIRGGSKDDTPDGHVSDGINEYEYNYKPPTNDRLWKYYVFILKNQDPASSYHIVNIKALFDILIREGSLKNDWILPSMSLGNEVWKGSGKIEISKFSININGSDV